MNNSEIRQEARYVLKGNWVNASLTLFLYGVLSSIGFIIALVVGGMFSALTSMGDLSRISILLWIKYFLEKIQLFK